MATWVTFGSTAAVLACTLFFFFFLRRNASQRQPYSLHHGRLNIRLPPQSMWMNMGFWHSMGDRKPASDLPEACQALLNRVFASAGLLEQHPEAESSVGKHKINLVDVGFGCGDQILEMFAGDGFGRVHIQNYVGITNSKQQFGYADTRLRAAQLRGDCTTRHGSSRVEIFGEDAAVPDRWSLKLRQSVDALPPNDVWLLGLDSLYHLSPSRLPLFEHAFQKLGASIMAFDLLLVNDYDSLPILTKLILRLVCVLTAVPFRNLMTEQDYREMLVRTGYSTDDIVLVDISEGVFGPLADFLEAQQRELRAIGMGLGALRPAKTMFRWWANSGIVRGYIVTARRG